LGKKLVLLQINCIGANKPILCFKLKTLDAIISACVFRVVYFMSITAKMT